MKGWFRRSIVLGLGATGVLGLGLLLVYGCLLLLRPPRTIEERVLFQGVTYRREPRSVPRPLMIHTVTVDLTQPGIRFVTTPGATNPQGRAFRAQTTTEFLQRFHLKLAMNASFFYPFHENNPLDFYPRSGEGVDVFGQVIVNGVEYSKPRGGWAVLCILKNNQVQIPNQIQCPPGTVQAIAGALVLIDRGKPQPIDPAILKIDKANPRSVVGLDRTGKKMWWVLIDGRQPFYSEGVFLPELVQILQEIGIHTALALDGGGSTTLVMAEQTGPRLLNSPIHTRIPLRQRFLANHLGIDIQPIAK